MAGGPRFLTQPEIREAFGPHGLDVLPSKVLEHLGSWLPQLANKGTVRKREVDLLKLAQRSPGQKACRFEYNVSDVKKWLKDKHGVDVRKAEVERTNAHANKVTARIGNGNDGGVE